MPRKEQGWITFQTSQEERKILEDFCKESQRTKTEILRELVRSLGNHSSTPPSLPTIQEVEQDADSLEVEVHDEQHEQIPLQLSSRNILKGVVKRVITGVVNSEVTLEIVHKVELTSMITRVSAGELGLAEGQEAYAVIKSNDIVIASD